jgi:hypothetical protein
VGPITVAVTAGGSPVAGADIEFAVLPRGVRPVEIDWQPPDLDPDPPGTALGVFVDPVLAYGRWGIWIRVTDTPEIPVLEPSQVGWIVRS